ncbi:UNKNOWN [Stylonychia lemnae]|uniref:DnaJ-like protein C11 C-terminal domain-containing protein n=1 Tax=Stylonychia lemnae TaxID=5949 RepID=A0A078A548_STYLE|nr:UNKNOWN [Stylonychia lemnae]|eukprot:CDW77329.1 UNKNOWN [Stylonychia lemnae]
MNQDNQQNQNNIDLEDNTNLRVSLPQTQYFSHEALREMSKRFKEQNKENQHDMQMNWPGQASEDNLLYYGDTMCFEQRYINDLRFQRFTTDNKFTFAADFIINEKTQMRMNCLVSNKNKQVVGFLYPKFKYQFRPKTQLEGGFSVGSIHRRMIGISHILSPKLSVGYQAELCYLRKQLTHSFSAKEKFGRNSYLTTTYSNNSQGKYNFKIKNDNYIDDQVTQNYQNLMLRSAKKVTSIVSIRENKIEAQAMSSHKISRRFRSRLQVGASMDSEVSYSAENEFKWQFRDHVRLYSGLRYSIDGWQFLFGIKIAGLKLKIPLIFIEGEGNQETEEVSKIQNYPNWFKYSLIIGGFVLGTYIMKMLDNNIDKKKITKWIQNSLIKLKDRQEDSLLLIKDRSIRNQRQIESKLFIMRALYGQKSEIKKFIDRFQGGDRLNQITSPYESSFVSEMPYGISDVTIPIRFSLEPNGLTLEKMKTKENILGFFNPIPPFRMEHDNPVLCIIYKRQEESDTIRVSYYSDDEEVKILIDVQQ